MLLLNTLSLLENIDKEYINFDTWLFIYRIVSLDMNANISSEVEILCSQGDCSLIEPIRIAVMKDKMYVIENSKRTVSVFKGISRFNICLVCVHECGHMNV